MEYNFDLGLFLFLRLPLVEKVSLVEVVNELEAVLGQDLDIIECSLELHLKTVVELYLVPTLKARLLLFLKPLEPNLQLPLSQFRRLLQSKLVIRPYPPQPLS